MNRNVDEHYGLHLFLSSHPPFIASFPTRIRVTNIFRSPRYLISGGSRCRSQILTRDLALRAIVTGLDLWSILTLRATLQPNRLGLRYGSEVLCP